MANSMALPSGTELGEYTIIRKLGQGGFGITYLARDNANNCDVVIKENLPSVFAFRTDTSLYIRPHGDGEPEENYRWALQRFCDEAQTINKLSHPNIVKILRAFKALGTAYYVMPYVKGESLSSVFKTSAQLNGEKLLSLLRQILSALSYLHSQGVMHRDLKPANILIKNDETPILIDFGAARSYISERSATLVGTPGYSPIEQVTPNGTCGPWTDLYALGATCYRLIREETVPDSLNRVYDTDPYIPLSTDPSLCKRFPRELLKTIDKALRMDISKRWQTADEWLAAISPARMKKSSSGSSFAATAAIAALIATAGGGAWYYYGQEADKGKEPTSEPAEPLPAPKTHEEQVKAAARERLAELGISEEDYNTKLGEAAISNDNEVLGLLIAAGADVNYDTRNRWTPLTYVCAKQNLTGIQLLLNAPGIDVNKQNQQGDTAIIWAAAKGHLEGLRLLLAVPGINVNFIDSEGKTAYDWAVTNNLEECVQLLRDNGGKTADDVRGGRELIPADEAKAKLQEAGITENNYNDALGIAAARSDNEKIHLLISAGVDINSDLGNGQTALTIVCTNRNLDGLRLLLAAPGINVNKPNRRGDNAIICAAFKGDLESLRLLLATPGINVNFIDGEGKTAYDWAVMNEHNECAQLLRNNGGTTASNAQDISEQTSADEAKAKLQEAGITESNYNAELCKATDNSDNEKIRLLISAGANVNCYGEDGWTPLTNVCLLNNPEGLRLLLAAPNIDINQPNKSGDTAIIWAAVKGHTSCLRMLLAVPGIEVNFIDSENKTAYDWATINNHQECAELLRAAGGQRTSQDTISTELINCDSEEARRRLQNLGISPSQYNEAICNATDNSDNEKLALLINAGADVNCRASDGWMPLTNLSVYNNQQGMRLILNAPNLNVNATDGKGNNALSIAAFNGHTDCVRLLLSHPAIRVNNCDGNGNLPLIYAVVNKHQDCVRLLLEAPGINVNTRNRAGDTALIWAAAKGNTEALQTLLSVPGINLDIINENGKTAYDRALESNNNECAKLLRNAGAHTAEEVLASHKTRTSSANIAEANTMLCTATDNGDNNKIYQALTAGADVNCDAEDGWTPLTNVAYYGHRESMRLLLTAPGIDVNKLNQKGYSALSIAALKGHTDCVRMLLEAPGINVNLENKSGTVPLCWAAESGAAESLRLLLDAPGININYVDSNGKTALDWAESTNNTVCAQLLRAAGAKRANQL